MPNLVRACPRSNRTGRGCGRSLGDGRTRAVRWDRQFWRFAAFAVLGMTAGCKAKVQVVPLPFERIVQDAGMNQAGTEPPATPAYRLFHDAGSWESFWERSVGPAPPAVDFAREFALCVYMGMKPTGGYAIAVRGVQFDAAHRRLDCTLELTKPDPGTMLIQVLTSPYAIYRVSLPTGVGMPSGNEVEIRFYREQQGAKVPVELRHVQEP